MARWSKEPPSALSFLGLISSVALVVAGVASLWIRHKNAVQAASSGRSPAEPRRDGA
jgi:hypothetical protein